MLPLLYDLSDFETYSIYIDSNIQVRFTGFSTVDIVLDFRGQNVNIQTCKTHFSPKINLSCFKTRIFIFILVFIISIVISSLFSILYLDSDSTQIGTILLSIFEVGVACLLSFLVYVLYLLMFLFTYVHRCIQNSYRACKLKNVAQNRFKIKS